MLSEAKHLIPLAGFMALPPLNLLALPATGKQVGT